MDPTLRLHPGQQALTPAQEAEARRFAEERIAAQLSTEPVDELEAERLLQQAYAEAKLPPPQHISWVDGPLQLIAALAPENIKAISWSLPRGDVDVNLWDSVWAGLYGNVEDSVEYLVGESIWERVGATVQEEIGEWVQERALNSVSASVEGYQAAPSLAYYRFFDAYLAPNELHALAHFNELVSGYWLGHEEAFLVRRPHLLSRDAEGFLHSATGKCLEYRDGWGFYAWHGVRVPERVILAPETLTREDFLSEQDVEVRRVIQERMGERFVSELGGVVIDAGPRGTLYEVALPEDDPEQVARYVRVQDASTFRQYFLRVPPTVQTAAEAVAWTFQVAAEDYHPAQET